MNQMYKKVLFYNTVVFWSPCLWFLPSLKDHQMMLQYTRRSLLSSKFRDIKKYILWITSFFGNFTCACNIFLSPFIAPSFLPFSSDSQSSHQVILWLSSQSSFQAFFLALILSLWLHILTRVSLNTGMEKSTGARVPYLMLTSLQTMTFFSPIVISSQ